MPTSLHTAGQGWLWFRHPSDLGFKASSGSIDLYVAPHGFDGTPEDLRAALTARPPPVGFDVATDTSKHRNVVLRHLCPRFLTGEGVPAATAELDAALDACARITEWFDGGGEELLRSASARAPSRHAQVDGPARRVATGTATGVLKAIARQHGGLSPSLCRPRSTCATHGGAQAS